MRTPSSERPTSIEGCILAAERARIFQLDPNGERLPPEDTPELHRQERFQDLFNALAFDPLGPALAGKSELRIANRFLGGVGLRLVGRAESLEPAT